MSLVDLKNGIKGLAIMSFDLEKIFQCINEGRVPAQWLKGKLNNDKYTINLFINT